MKTSIIGLLLILVAHGCSFVSAQTQPVQKGSSEESLPAGDWRGDSLCVVKQSACRDEDSFYHFAQVPEKPGHYSLKAEKIVGGKTVSLGPGTIDCLYDPQQILECALPNGSTLRFSVKGGIMLGTMILSDKTLWRKLKLERVTMSNASSK